MIFDLIGALYEHFFVLNDTPYSCRERVIDEADRSSFLKEVANICYNFLTAPSQTISRPIIYIVMNWIISLK